MLPLEGVTVVGLEQAVAAPFATRQLADLGARVVKVERPGGDFARDYDASVLGQSSYFVWLNRSKESIGLDLKTVDGLEVLARLLSGADVFVQNLGPGAAARLGLDARTLKSRYRALIVCDISGYGSDGPWANRKAYDLLVQCECGLASLTGTPDEAAKVGISVVDIAAGMYAFSGILSALYLRATTGEARAVQVSLFDSISEWMGSPAYVTAYSGRQPARYGVAHATIAPYGPYRCRDQRELIIAVQNDREWAVFCKEVLDRGDLVLDERFAQNCARVTNRAELEKIVAGRFEMLDAETAINLLDRSGIAHARMNDVADLLCHPVLEARGRWHAIDTPAGPVTALLPPAMIEGIEARMGSVPGVGQHSRSILKELGYEATEIEHLISKGVVYMNSSGSCPEGEMAAKPN